ncbi:hypothetical protein IWZ01DRAFT_487027 [Phyllosticta capitalensis]
MRISLSSSRSATLTSPVTQILSLPSRKRRCGGDDDGEDRRAPDLRMTHEQLAATMAQFGPTPKVFKAIVPFDQATYDNCVHEADFPDPRGTGFGHGQNQRHRAHQAYTCCCIDQLPVDDQCILRGMQYLPMQLGALFYRIYLPHLQHNVQTLPLDMVKSRLRTSTSLHHPSTAELVKLHNNVADKHAKFEANRSASDSHLLAYLHLNDLIDVDPDLPLLKVPTRSASNASPLARNYSQEDIDFIAIPCPLTMAKKKQSAALSSFDSECQRHQ